MGSKESFLLAWTIYLIHLYDGRLFYKCHVISEPSNKKTSPTSGPSSVDIYCEDELDEESPASNLGNLILCCWNKDNNLRYI